MAHLNKDRIEILIQKLNFYKEEENLNFEEIEVKLNKLNELYKTKNTIYFEEKKETIINNNNTININNNNNITIYNKMLNKYISTAYNVSETFSNIDTL